MFVSRRHLNMGDYFQSRTEKWETLHNDPLPNRLLRFCDMILRYEKYKVDKDVEMDDESFSSSSSERTSDSFLSENDSFTEDKYSSGEDVKVGSDKDDSWNLITCYCMKPFRGRPMIECTLCGTWIHMSCAKVRPNNVPDIFVCQFCQKPKDTKRRSERIRNDDRRFSP